jgi:adenylate kinase
MEAGELVPDEVVTEVVRERLQADDVNGHGYLLDGFPRNVTQADILDAMLGRDGIDLVIELVVPTQVVLRRLASRRVCENCGMNYSASEPPKENWTCDRCGSKVVQRDDDTETAILRRLDLYKQETEPLVAYYLAHDKLASVDGTGPTDKVSARLFRAIDSRLKSMKPAD